MGTTSDAVQSDRFAAAAELAARLAGVVVLKGASTLVASDEAGIAVNTNGNAGMATAGTGDVLAGMCAAFALRDSDLFEAARYAVYVHGLAGDIACERLGADSLIATDIIKALPDALKPSVGNEPAHS